MQPEGHGGPCAMGEQGSAPSGVYDYGTLEEDGPDTWETLIAPCGTRARVGRRQGTTGAEADGDEVYRLRVLGQWFDGIRFYAAASSPRRSRRTWAGLR